MCGQLFTGALGLKLTAVGPVATAPSFLFLWIWSHGSGKAPYGPGLPFLTWLSMQGLVATVSEGSCGFL